MEPNEKKLSIIGVFAGVFSRKAPTDKQFIKKDGDLVKKGDRIGFITTDVFGAIEEVTSDYEGKNLTFKVEDGERVYPVQTIAKITIDSNRN